MKPIKQILLALLLAATAATTLLAIVLSPVCGHYDTIFQGIQTAVS